MACSRHFSLAPGKVAVTSYTDGRHDKSYSLKGFYLNEYLTLR